MTNKDTSRAAFEAWWKIYEVEQNSSRGEVAKYLVWDACQAFRKQALDALESDPCCGGKVNNAIDALRVALAQPESEPVAEAVVQANGRFTINILLPKPGSERHFPAGTHQLYAERKTK